MEDNTQDNIIVTNLESVPGHKITAIKDLAYVEFIRKAKDPELNLTSAIAREFRAHAEKAGGNAVIGVTLSVAGFSKSNLKKYADGHDFFTKHKVTTIVAALGTIVTIEPDVTP